MKIHFAVLVVLFSYLVLCFGQRCHMVPVCDDTDSPTTLKGDKGDQGVPGKAGPAGVGTQGPKGCKGEMGECDTFRRNVENKLAELETLLTPASCSHSSVYGLQTLRSGEEAFCDGGWTVLQRRWDGSQNFDLLWEDYKSGFGNKSGEFWLGLDKIHQLTAGRGCRLRVDLWDFENNQAYAEYRVFSVEGESDNYRLHVDGYSGTAGNSLRNNEELHNGRQFTTRDRDNDRYSSHNCAALANREGGWWYDSCFRASLNAPWGESVGTWTRINWYGWRGSDEALKATTMKLRCD